MGQTWEPSTPGGVERRKGMHYSVKTLSQKERIRRAVGDVLVEKRTSYGAAKYYGLDQRTVRKYVAEAAAAEAERVAEEDARGVAPLVVSGERRRLPTDVVEFTELYFGGLKCWNCTDGEGEPVRHELPEFHKEMMRRMVSPDEKRMLVNMPPEHSKTTNGTVITSLFDIAHNPNIQMAVFSAGEDLAKDIVGQMQMFLEDHSVYEGSARNLILDAGPFNDGGVTWTQKQFVVAGRQSFEKDPTVRAFGINSKVYGRRLHRIICDDVADLDNSDTAEKVEKMFAKITSTLDSRVGGNGRLQVVGTRVGPADVYARLLDLPGYTVMRRPCIVDFEEGLTLWPDHIDFEEAMRRRARMKPEQWELFYQNNDYVVEGADYTREQLERCHDGRVLGQLPDEPLWLSIGVDPAGYGKQAGFTAMVLLGVDASGKRWLVDAVNVRSMSATQIRAQVFDWVQNFTVRTARFEAVALQGQIFDTPEYRQFLTNHGTKLEFHHTHGGGGNRGGNMSVPGRKSDPDWGVAAMAVQFHNGQVSLPYGDRRAKSVVDELSDQLMRFPMKGGPTDLMMAYWIAETACKSFVERGRTRLFTRRQYSEPPPASMLRRRRVNGRAGPRSARAADFGVSDTKVPPPVLASGHSMSELVEEGWS